MKLDYFILGLLRMEPRTGYEIKKFLDAEGRFARARAPLSQIYTTLKRMLENGWVEYEEVQREGKPDLKIYHNSEAGNAALLEYLNSPLEPSFRYMESDIRNRIIFAYLVEPETIIEQLHTELEYRKEQIAAFRNRDRTVQTTTLSDCERAYAQELMDKLHSYGAKSIDDYVLWLEEMIDYFSEKEQVENGS